MPEYATAAAMIADKANIANGTRVRVLTDERLPASNPAEHRTSIYTKTNGTAATALSPADFTWSQLPGSNAKMPMLTIRGPGSLRGHRLQAADLGGPGFYFNGPGDEANIESWGAGHLHLRVAGEGCRSRVEVRDRDRLEQGRGGPRQGS